MAARGVDAARQQDFAQQIEHIVRHGIANQRFIAEIFRLPHVFLRQWMVGRANTHHFIRKQRLVHNACLRHGFRHNSNIRAVGEQQADRVGLEAGHDIQFHLRPLRTEHAHGRHQPVEAGVAFHRQTELTRIAVDNLHQVAFCRGYAGQQFAPQLEQAFAGGREAQRRGFAFKQQRAEMVFQHADLVRQGRLR